MNLIDTITVEHEGSERFVKLLVGDLASLPAHEAVDVLVVSAFPDDYLPTPSSLIGALDRAGVSVADLAADKEIDLRRFSSCWLSRPIQQPNVPFNRILCFEPLYRGKAPELVGDVYRSIIPFTATDPPISQLAMPLLASGDQGETPVTMLDALTDASVHWLSAGLPIDCIKIVISERSDAQPFREAFARIKQQHANASSNKQRPEFRYDVFVSYSHSNKDEVDALVMELRRHRPDLRIFVDRQELRTGAAWQQHIYNSIDQSRKVICAFSQDYLQSKNCMEEFHIAMLRHREAAHGVLPPPLSLYCPAPHIHEARPV